MEKKVIQIGQMDNTKDHTFESANRVYYRGGNAQLFQPVQAVIFSQRQLRK